MGIEIGNEFVDKNILEICTIEALFNVRCTFFRLKHDFLFAVYASQKKDATLKAGNLGENKWKTSNEKEKLIELKGILIHSNMNLSIVLAFFSKRRHYKFFFILE